MRRTPRKLAYKIITIVRTLATSGATTSVHRWSNATTDVVQLAALEMIKKFWTAKEMTKAGEKNSTNGALVEDVRRKLVADLLRERVLREAWGEREEKKEAVKKVLEVLGGC